MEPVFDILSFEKLPLNIFVLTSYELATVKAF